MGSGGVSLTWTSLGWRSGFRVACSCWPPSVGSAGVSPADEDGTLSSPVTTEVPDTMLPPSSSLICLSALTSSFSSGEGC